MRLKCIFLSVFFLCFSCKTRKINVDKSKRIERVEHSVINDSSINLHVKRSTQDFFGHFSTSESLFQKLGLSYSGQTNEDRGVVKINQNAQGLEVEVSGPFNLDFDHEQLKQQSITRSEAISLLDSIFKTHYSQNKEERLNRLLKDFQKQREVTSKGSHLWWYLLGGLVLVILINRMRLK